MIRTFENKLIVWGARGGLPTSGNDYSKFGHATCCVHLETENKNFVFDAGTSLADVVDAINAIGTTSSDLVAILEALRAAGALRAQMIII